MSTTKKNQSNLLDSFADDVPKLFFLRTRPSFFTNLSAFIAICINFVGPKFAREEKIVFFCPSSTCQSDD